VCVKSDIVCVCVLSEIAFVFKKKFVIEKCILINYLDNDNQGTRRQVDYYCVWILSLRLNACFDPISDVSSITLFLFLPFVSKYDSFFEQFC